MALKDMTGACNNALRLAMLPMPRTCAVCGLGPCRRGGPDVSMETQIQVDLSKDELRLVTHAAYRKGKPIFQFAKDALIESAKQYSLEIEGLVSRIDALERERDQLRDGLENILTIGLLAGQKDTKLDEAKHWARKALGKNQ